MIFENMKLALKAMAHSKIRTVLSLLGIVIGVAAVVAILTLGQSATKSITESILSSGLDLVTIYPRQNSEDASFYDEFLTGKIERNVDGIEAVLPIYSGYSNVRYKQDIVQSQITGVESIYADTMSYTPSEGRWFTSEENILKKQVAVLGADIAEDLFPAGNAIGSYISIYRTQAKSYQIVGVMEKKDASLNLSYNSLIYIPFNTYTQRFNSKQRVSSYVIKVGEGEDALKVSDDVENYLKKNVSTNSYNIFSPASLASMSDEITGTFSAFLAAVAGISLLVGGIGIMNIMLVSVAERTKEIGIRKALGATPKKIKGQFITEAIVLTLVGGFLGILFGTLISAAVTDIMKWKLYISYDSYLLAAGFSMIIGVFFGWYPANKAAKLDPIEALNYE